MKKLAKVVLGLLVLLLLAAALFLYWPLHQRSVPAAGNDKPVDVVLVGGGIMSITGNEGQPPSRVGMSIGDIGAGLYTAVAVNAAIVHRLKTGESTKVDIAMFDCQLALLENAIMRYTVEKEIPGPLGARHPSITPFAAYSCADAPIVIDARPSDAVALALRTGAPLLAAESLLRIDGAAGPEAPAPLAAPAARSRCRATWTRPRCMPRRK